MNTESTQIAVSRAVAFLSSTAALVVGATTANPALAAVAMVALATTALVGVE